MLLQHLWRTLLIVEQAGAGDRVQPVLDDGGNDVRRFPCTPGADDRYAHLLAHRAGKAVRLGYNGYGSCPLTVERGKIVLAEFGYGGKLLPSFPKAILNGLRPTRLAWHLKADLLPQIYWHAMLKGREWMIKNDVKA